MPSADSSEDLADQVASAIAERIAQGEYGVGTQLPALRALAAELDVSLTTVRSAITILEEALLVRTKPRVGTIVNDPKLQGGVRAWSLLIRHASSNATWLRAWLEDALRIRHMLSMRVLYDLAETDTEVARERLEQALAELKRVVAETPQDQLAIVDAETGILRALIDTTGHPAMLGLVNEVHSLVTRSPMLRELIAPDVDMMIQRWTAVAALLGDLTAENVQGIIGPFLRHGATATLDAFDEWVERQRAESP